MAFMIFVHRESLLWREVWQPVKKVLGKIVRDKRGWGLFYSDYMVIIRVVIHDRRIGI